MSAASRTQDDNAAALPRLEVHAANQRAAPIGDVQRLACVAEHAFGRGRRTFYLDTFGFQAPGFYRKLSYAPVRTSRASLPTSCLTR